MNIVHVTAVGMHGYLSFNADFKEDLNIIVGINGTGKTSAINIIEWLTKPNIEKLLDLNFEKISVTFRHLTEMYRVTASRKGININVILQSTEDNFENIEFSASKDSKQDWNMPTALLGYYPGKAPWQKRAISKEEEKFILFMKKFPSVTVVSLERLMKAEVENKTIIEVHSSSSDSVQTPVDYVQKLFSKRMLRYREDVSKSDDALKHSIMLAAISSPAKNITTEDMAFSIENVTGLKEKISEILKIGSDKKSTVAVNEFFDDFHKTYYYLTESNAVDGALGGHIIKLFKQQLHRVYQLAGAVSNHEKQKLKYYEDISTFISSVNEFFSQTGKRLVVDLGTSQLGFVARFGSESNKRNRTIRDLGYLSSGEAQIVVLFGLLSLSANPNSVFIVDEPEISLHPHWQNTFMKSFVEICPSETQLIVATHSPEIVAGNKEKCIVFGFNQ